MIFRSDSYWNTPLPTDVTRDKDSDKFIAWLKSHNRNPFLALGSGAWAMPVYRSNLSDPLVTINPSGTGPTATFRLPRTATAADVNDGQLSVIDITTNQDISLFEFSRAAGGTPKAKGLARYWLDSEGLEQKVGGTAGNQGHRVIPGLASCVHLEDMVTLSHRTKIAIPGTGEWGCFPMSGYERNRGGIIGEGIVIRIKPNVDLSSKNLSLNAFSIAYALQTFGAVVGDNGGQATLKIQAGVNIARDALKALTWDDYEFVVRGWKPG